MENMENMEVLENVETVENLEAKGNKYKIVTHHSYDGFYTLAKIFYDFQNKKPKIMLYIAAVVSAALAFYRYSLFGTDSQMVVYLAVSVFSLHTNLNNPKMAARKMSRNKKVLENKITYSVSDTIFKVQDGFGTQEIGYELFYNLFETEDYYMLFLNKKMCHMLKKSDFKKGDVASFKGYIEERTMKQFRYVNIQKGKI